MNETNEFQEPYTPALPSPVRPNDLVAHLAACGVNTAAIAEQSGLDPQFVRTLLLDEKMQFQIKLLRHKYFKDSPIKKRFEILAEKAYEVTETLMNDEREKATARLKAAGMVFDRAFGKAEQTVNLEGGSMIRALFERLDRGGEIPPPAPADPIDSAKTIDVDKVESPNTLISSEKSTPKHVDDFLNKHF